MDDKRLTEALPPSIGLRVESARLVNGRALIVLDATGLSPAQREDIEKAVIDILKGIEGVDEVRVALTAQKPKRRIIAIGSGKGGVGKSTLTANLAVALKRLGCKVGIVDGDIYGPSQPKLFGVEGKKPQVAGDKLVPVPTSQGIPVLSMGFLVKPAQALAWRGPMAGNALGQLIDADWGDTDLLLLDLPPGTGDIQLSMLQKHRPAGAILVSTPQDLALIDAARAGQLFETGEVPIIGLVENMAGYRCPHCGELSDPFGSGGFEALARQLEIPFLGRVPLDIDIRRSSDGGTPIAGDAADSASPARAFDEIAQAVKAWLDRPEHG